jgi:hypothetical protein
VNFFCLLQPPPESTVVVKIGLHCNGCIDRIKRTAHKIKGNFLSMQLTTTLCFLSLACHACMQQYIHGVVMRCHGCWKLIEKEMTLFAPGPGGLIHHTRELQV